MKPRGIDLESELLLALADPVPIEAELIRNRLGSVVEWIGVPKGQFRGSGGKQGGKRGGARGRAWGGLLAIVGQSGLPRRGSAARWRRGVCWGVCVDKAGLPTLSPSAKSLRITQLDERVAERQARYQAFRRNIPSPLASALVGTRRFPRSETKRLIRMAIKRAAVHKQARERILFIQKLERED